MEYNQYTIFVSGLYTFWHRLLEQDRQLLSVKFAMQSVLKGGWQKRTYSKKESVFYCYITFCVSRRRRKIYCGHARLCVCLCVCVSACLSAAVRPHYCTDPDVTWVRGRGCPLVVHYWADLQSVHGLRCCGNIMRTLVTSLRPSRDMTTSCQRSAGCARAAGRWLAVVGGHSQHYCGGLHCAFHWWHACTRSMPS